MKTVLLGEICNIKIGRTPPRREEQWFSAKQGEKWVSIKDMGNAGKNIISTSEYLTPDAVDKFHVPLIKAGTLILSFKLTVGRLGFASEDMYSNEAIAQLPVKDVEQVDKDWLYYYLKNFDYNSLSSTSSIATAVNSQTIKNIPIQLPKLADQKKIASILRAIDEKIELNRRMNETLEKIGQALFKHYFIDNPEAKTWPKGKISDLGEVITGKTPSKANKDFYGEDVLFLKVPDMHSQRIIIATVDHLSELGAQSQKKKYISQWSTCVSCIATVGVVSLAGEALQTNQQINSVVPKNKYNRFYNYFVVRKTTELIKTMASGGTATLNLNKGQFANIKVILPPEKGLVEFDEIVTSLFELMLCNVQEKKNLIALRDSLLPRLISGKIKVNK